MLKGMLTPKDLWSSIDKQDGVPYDFINNKFDKLINESGNLHYKLYIAMQQGYDTIEINKDIDKVGEEIDSLLFLYPHLKYR